MEEKHAYMIMAHNDFPILVEILKELDHERNEIFVHIDKKAKEFPEDDIRGAVRKGKLYLIPRMSVSWGGYSQIKCELSLMEHATKSGHHEYYHMTTGATFPLKTADEILQFFDEHSGYQFIGYDNSKDCSERVQRVNIFNELGKVTTKSDQRKAWCRNKFTGLQRRLGYVYKPARGIEFKKGFVYWSLTEEAVTYALGKSEEIERVFKHSFCGDELFMQTILYHSTFRKAVYNYNDEYGSCLRYVKPVQSWKPGFNGSSIAQTNLKETGIGVADISNCKKSGMLFGLKFVEKTGLDAIAYLREIRKAEN